MATLNVLLDSRRAKSGKVFPLKVRITHGKASVYHSLELDLVEKEWDRLKQRVRSNHPLHKKVNLKISSVLNQMQEIILDLEKKGKPYSAEMVKSIFNGDKEGYKFLEYGLRQVTQLRESNRFGNARTYRESLKKFSDFLSGKDCRFEELDFTMLTRFETTMLKEGLKINSISVYLRSLRAIYNRAVKDGIADRNGNPFLDFHIKSEKTPSRSLTIDEMRMLIQYPLKDDGARWRFRQIFLCSFAFIGMSFIDMSFLKHSNISDGRLNYRRRKTGRLYSIALNEYNESILRSLSCNQKVNNDFIMPIINFTNLDEEQAIKASRDVYSRCNKYLKIIADEVGLEDSISTYWARYTWANIARKLGYSKDMIAEALGHSYGNRVTSIYLDDYEAGVIDEMNYTVLRNVFS